METQSLPTLRHSITNYQTWKEVLREIDLQVDEVLKIIIMNLNGVRSK
jgi:hypothetical protein